MKYPGKFLSFSKSLSLSKSLSPTVPVSFSPSVSKSLSPTVPVSFSSSVPKSLIPSVRESFSFSFSKSLNPSVPVSFSSSVSKSLSPSLPESLSHCVSQSLRPSIRESFSPTVSKSLRPLVRESFSFSVSKSLSLILLLLISFTSAGLCQDKAPDFNGKTINGKQIKLSDYAGKVVLLDFWASWCPPCREEMPELVKFYKAHNNPDFVLIAVNIDDKSTNMERFLDKLFPVPEFPIVVDDHQQIPPLFKIDAMPTTIFVDKKGNIRFRHDGFRSEYVNDFSNELSQLLKES